MKKLKKPDMKLSVNGVGIVTNENANDLYETVVKINPSLQEFFEDVPDQPEKNPVRAK